MEKEFETYEYFVKYNGNVENNTNTGQQMFIVQGNGHVINVNKPILYEGTEETKVLENVACSMFDVNQQPVYFQLNNSSQLIPISVNTIPTVEPLNVFENTYLLPNLTVEVAEPENDIPNKHNNDPFTPNLKEESEGMEVDSNNLSDGCDEITLNDEQYEILKQKGWILLEIKDKVLLLDSSGLHEITNDQDLIMKLKHETNQPMDNNSQPVGGSMKEVVIPENTNTNNEILLKQEDCEQNGTVREVNDEVHKEGIGHQVTEDPMVSEIPLIPFKLQENDPLNNDSNVTSQGIKKPNKISAKTSYLLKDIPKEIVLGKTVNGKKLIARVIKGKSFLKKDTKINHDMRSEVGRDRNINDKQFAKLIQQILHGTAENCRTEDVASVKTIMSQMFRVPDLRADLQKQKLIVTKTVREESEDGLIKNQSEPAVITGRFIMNESEGGFVHIPDMLLQHMKNSEMEVESQNYDNEKDKSDSAILEDDVFLHVNITETKDVNNISRISVMVNKRYLSLSQVYNMKTKHINAVYACTACAKVFKSQEELDEHQEFQCSKVPVLSTDDEQPYTIVKTHNRIKVYMCNECKAKFVKLIDCREHLKIHCRESGQEAAKFVESCDGEQSEVFKCKMCENTFFHSSSLTKHILAKHIKPKK